MTITLSNFENGVHDDQTPIMNNTAIIVLYPNGTTQSLTYYTDDLPTMDEEIIIDPHLFRTLFDNSALIKMDKLEYAVNTENQTDFLAIAVNEDNTTASVSMGLTRILFKNLYSAPYITLCNGTEAQMGLSLLVSYGALTQTEYDTMMSNRLTLHNP